MYECMNEWVSERASEQINYSIMANHCYVPYIWIVFFNCIAAYCSYQDNEQIYDELFITEQGEGHCRHHGREHINRGFG